MFLIYRHVGLRERRRSLITVAMIFGRVSLTLTATLTMPGIIGLPPPHLSTIGIAVDSFQRADLRAHPRGSERGRTRSRRSTRIPPARSRQFSIRTSTTFIAAAVLFFIGTAR